MPAVLPRCLHRDGTRQAAVKIEIIRHAASPERLTLHTCSSHRRKSDAVPIQCRMQAADAHALCCEESNGAWALARGVDGESVDAPAQRVETKADEPRHK